MQSTQFVKQKLSLAPPPPKKKTKTKKTPTTSPPTTTIKNGRTGVKPGGTSLKSGKKKNTCNFNSYLKHLNNGQQKHAAGCFSAFSGQDWTTKGMGYICQGAIGTETGGGGGGGGGVPLQPFINNLNPKQDKDRVSVSSILWMWHHGCGTMDEWRLPETWRLTKSNSFKGQ